MLQVRALPGRPTNYEDIMYRKKDDKPLGGTTVIVRNGDVNGAMRVLKKRLMGDGFFQELRERSFYESRGTKRRKEKAAATRRYKRNMQKRKDELGY
jgi:small subunit ribosomal protein S21